MCAYRKSENVEIDTKSTGMFANQPVTAYN